MSRTIYVTGGQFGFAKGRFREKNGADLTGVTFKVGLSDSRITPPTTWTTPEDVEPLTLSEVRLSMRVTETNAPAGSEVYLWARPEGAAVEVQPAVASNDTIHTL